jgi:hypothetical protein
MRRSVLAAACGGLSALAFASPAFAEKGGTPTKATNFAAGQMKGTLATGKLMLASVGVRSGGKKVDILVRDTAGTESACSHATAGGITAAIPATGKFKATVPLNAIGTAAKGTVSFKGEFVKDPDVGNVVLIVARAKVPLPGGKVCDSGDFALLGVNPAKGQSGEADAGARFVGLLEAKSTIVPVKLPILVNLSKDGKTILTGATTVTAKCTSGKLNTNGLLSVHDGAITGTTFTDQDSGLFTDAANDERSIRVNILKGVFGSTKLTGTFDTTETIQDAAGTTTKDTCKSGPVKFTATRVA